jgi:biotin operon repressor
VEDSVDNPQLGAVAASRLPAVRVPAEVAVREDPGPQAEPETVSHAVRRHWRPILPLPITAGLLGVGQLLHAAANGIEIALIGGAVLGVAGLVYAWRKLTTPRARAWAACVLAGGWLAALLTAWLGAGPPVGGLIWIGGALLAAPWWWRHRTREAEPEPEPAPVADPEPAPEPDAVRIVETWQRHVATMRGALAKSQLGEPVRFRYGWRATIGLERGVHVTADAIAATPRILSAYEAADGEAYVDVHPSGQKHLAMLVLLTTNPLKESTRWTGPTLDKKTGISVLGLYADGSPVRYRWWSEIGPIHDLIAGTSGAGKSGLVNELLAEERQSGMMTSVVIDPQQGQSVPDWADNVHRFAGDVETGIELLRRVEIAMYARNRHFAGIEWVDDKGRRRRGLPKWFPGCGLPLMVVTIEEAHAVLDDPEAALITERIAKMARKCGIKLRLIVQDPSVSQIGNRRVLRSQLTGGNVIVLRTGDRLGGQIATGGRLPADPYDIPAEWPDTGETTAGVGYIIGAEQRGAMMRISRVDDPYGWATSGQPCAEHPIDAAAFGDVGKPGASLTQAALGPRPQPSTASARTDFDQAAALNPAIGQLAAALDGLAQVIPMQRRPARPEEPLGGTVTERVAALMADGKPWRTGELAERLGCSDRMVRLALEQLRSDGWRVDPVGAWRYQLRQPEGRHRAG